MGDDEVIRATTAVVILCSLWFAADHVPNSDAVKRAAVSFTADVFATAEGLPVQLSPSRFVMAGR